MVDIAYTRIEGINPAGDSFSFGWKQLIPEIEVLSATEWAEGMAGVWEGLWSQIDQHYTPQTSFNRVATQYFEDGVLTGSGEALMSTIGLETYPISMPEQCAMVVTLKTAEPGRDGRGRFYLPAMSTVMLQANGRFSSAGVTVMLDWLEDFNNGTTGFAGAGPWVVAPANNSVAHLVTQLRIGDRVDSQRRRNNLGPELYQSFTIS